MKQIWVIFIHLKLWVAVARHNFKWVKSRTVALWWLASWLCKISRIYTISRDEQCSKHQTLTQNSKWPPRIASKLFVGGSKGGGKAQPARPPPVQSPKNKNKNDHISAKMCSRMRHLSPQIKFSGGECLQTPLEHIRGWLCSCREYKILKKIGAPPSVNSWIRHCVRVIFYDSTQN